MNRGWVLFVLCACSAVQPRRMVVPEGMRREAQPLPRPENKPPTPALQGVQPWRAVIVLGFVGFAYLLLCLHLVARLFSDRGMIWLSFWGWLAETVHCIAVFGLLLEMWLQLRGPTRPPPRIDIHS